MLPSVAEVRSVKMLGPPILEALPKRGAAPRSNGQVERVVAWLRWVGPLGERISVDPDCVCA
jgi:hypothetical protein